MRRLPLAIAIAVVLSGAAIPGMAAAQALSVGAGQAVRLSLPGPVRDVVVGDPMVADVSVINDRTLMVLGKRSGMTSLTAFDSAGGLLAERRVVVSEGAEDTVTVQRGAAATVYACGTQCSRLGGEAAAASAPAVPGAPTP